MTRNYRMYEYPLRKRWYDRTISPGTAAIGCIAITIGLLAVGF